MSSNNTQTNHLLQISTPLADNELILTSLNGTEAISTLFNFQLEMFSNNISITPTQLIGKPVSILISKGPTPRYFHGIINRFHIGPPTQSFLGRNYRAEIVPWLWFLTRTSDCRIYQNKTAKDIITDVFARFNFADYTTDKIQQTLQIRNYCVQYQETAFNFISRLMEEEGIFYYFTHAKNKHTLVLADATTAFTPLADEINYAAGSFADDCISKWEYHHDFGSGQHTFSAYDFERPSTKLQKSASTIIDIPELKNYECYSYLGSYDIARTRDDQSSTSMQAEDAKYEVIEGSSSYITFTSGSTFDLTIPQNTHFQNEQKSYVLIQVTHQAFDTTHTPNSNAGQGYDNQFLCIPKSTTYRKETTTPKPRIYGLQTAVTVGPAGEEIFTDEYGRIKVQFIWDRLGQNDDKSSCWIRVAQTMAGNQWGTIFIPRVGQEVVVSFLNGDPDQPLIIGSVYNANQMPPYTLPANSTQLGIKSHSSKDGGPDDANEMRLEDKKGEELFYLHAQKDFTRLVENDDTLDVKNNQATTIAKDRTIVISEGNASSTIKKGNRTVEINTGNDSLTIDQGNQTSNITAGKCTINAGQAIELAVGENSIKIDTSSITIQVGQNSIKLDPSGVTLQGMQINIKADTSLKLEGVMSEMDGTGMLTLKGAVTMIN